MITLWYHCPKEGCDNRPFQVDESDIVEAQGIIGCDICETECVCPEFNYLDELRESGITNMFGARPYLAAAMGLSKNDAGKILSAWMNTFSLRHPQ